MITEPSTLTPTPEQKSQMKRAETKFSMTPQRALEHLCALIAVDRVINTDDGWITVSFADLDQDEVQLFLHREVDKSDLRFTLTITESS